MTLPLPDLLLLGYLVWGATKGWRRRIGRELQALIKLLLVLGWLWGFDAYRWLRGTLGGVLQENPITDGMLGSLLAILLAIALLHWLREQFSDLIEARLSPETARSSGAVAGLLRSAAWGGALILILQQIPWLGDGFGESLTGRWLNGLLASGA